MKYMVMTYGDQSAWDPAGSGDGGYTEEQAAEHFRGMQALQEDLTASGELVAAFGLADPAHTQVIRVDGGAPVVSDGPYAETKEFLAGFGIVDVDGHDRAVALAARFAQVVKTRVELRPVDG